MQSPFREPEFLQTAAVLCGHGQLETLRYDALRICKSRQETFSKTLCSGVPSSIAKLGKPTEKPTLPSPPNVKDDVGEAETMKGKEIEFSLHSKGSSNKLGTC